MSVSETTAPKFCTSCGEQLEGVPKFCTACGKPIKSAAKAASEVTTSSPTIFKRIKTLLGVLKPSKANFSESREFLKNNFEIAHIAYLALFLLAMVDAKWASIALLLTVVAGYCLATIRSSAELRVNSRLRTLSADLKEKRAEAQRQQAAAAAEAEAKRRQEEMEAYRENKEKMARLVEERERKHREQLAAKEAKLAELKEQKAAEHEAILIQTRKVMDEEGLSKAEIAVEIAKQQVQFDKEIAELTLDSIPEEPQTHRVDPGEGQWVPEPQKTVSEASSATSPQLDEPFKVRKHGQIINWVIILTGLIPIYFIYDFMANGFGLPVLGSLGVAGVFLVLFLIDLIYFLPTLIYHASTGGKIIMFLLNSLFNWLFIPWLIFLFFAMSRNSSHRYREEMLYHQRNRG